MGIGLSRIIVIKLPRRGFSHAVELHFPCRNNHLRSKTSVFNIYRPSSLSTHSTPYSVFSKISIFSRFFAGTTPHEFIITGDFNIHLDNHTLPLMQFLSLLTSFNLTQHLIFSTRNKNSTLHFHFCL